MTDGDSDSEGNPHAGDRGNPHPGEEEEEPPWLEDLYKFVEEYDDADVVDGHGLWFDYQSRGGDYFPWRNVTELLVAVWAIVTRPSRRALQMLLDFLRFEDSSGRGFDRRDLPASAEHLVSRMRRRLPLLPVLKREIGDTAGNPTESMAIPLGTLLQRILDCPRAVEEYAANFAGHRLSTEERQANRIPDEHLTPIPNRHVGGSRKSYMNGEIMHTTAHMGVECITVGEGAGVRVTVGDTVLAATSTCNGDPIPCRIAGLFWEEPRVRCRQGIQLARGASDVWQRSQQTPQDDGKVEIDNSCSGSSTYSETEEDEDCSVMSTGASDDDGEATTGYLLARLNRFIFRDEMLRERTTKRTRHERGRDVWEVVNDPVEVRVDALRGVCVVKVAGASGVAHGEHGEDDVPTFAGRGFVTKTLGMRDAYMEKNIPWRRSGIDGLFFDRGADSVHANDHEYPVFSTGIVVSSDGFNYFSMGGSNFSVNSTYFALGCLNQSLLRRLRSWSLCTTGAPRARWEEDVGPFVAMIKMLQNGCRARVSTGDGNAITVSRCWRVHCLSMRCYSSQRQKF